MLRHFSLVLLMILTGCASAPPAQVLPLELKGGYKLNDNRSTPVGETAQLARQLGLRSAREAQYSGPAIVHVTLYEMTTSAGAFELVQKWKPEPGKLHFSQGPYFLLLESQSPPRQLQAFASALDSALKQESPHQ